MKKPTEFRKHIGNLGFDSKPIDLAQKPSELRAWFIEQGQGMEGQPYLLAHADNGVIWGRLDGETLVLSGDVFPGVSPKLIWTTLQQARLFSADQEVRVWRDGDGRQVARRITEREDVEGDAFDESYVLWGTQVIGDPAEGFTKVSEGRRGLHHAVPIVVPVQAFVEEPPSRRWRPLRLYVRHYLRYDEDTGQAYVALNRLLNVDYDSNEGGVL